MDHSYQMYTVVYWIRWAFGLSRKNIVLMSSELLEME